MPERRFSGYLLFTTYVPTFVSALVGLVFIIQWHRNVWTDNQRRSLVEAATFFGALIDEADQGLADPSLPRLAAAYAAVDGRRVTVVGHDGSVVVDTASIEPSPAATAVAESSVAPEIAAAFSGRVGFATRRSRMGDSYIFVAVPYRRDERIAAAVRIGSNLSKQQSALAELFSGLVVMALVYLVLTLALAMIISSIFGSFVRAAGVSAERIAAGQYDLRIGNTHIAELNLLADSINRMAARIGRTIVELEGARDELKKTVGMKEAYLKELQHRVKNNLNVVSGMINLEIANLTDERAVQVFKDTVSRIDAISQTYENLYRSADLETVELRPFLERLAFSIHRSYEARGTPIALDMELANVRVDSGKAVPLGLILNECLTNAFKYAFPDGRAGRVFIRLESTGTTLTFSVIDDGVGFVAGFNAESGTSLGLKLVRILSEQLRAELSIDGRAGVSIKLRFPATIAA